MPDAKYKNNFAQLLRYAWLRPHRVSRIAYRVAWRRHAWRSHGQRSHGQRYLTSGCTDERESVVDNAFKPRKWWLSMVKKLARGFVEMACCFQQ